MVSSSLKRWVGAGIVAIAIAVNMSAFYLSFQPGSPLGPTLLFAYLTYVLVGFAAIFLGHEIAERTSRTDQFSLLLAQIGSTVFVTTLGFMSGYISDRGWWEANFVLEYYLHPFLFVAPILVVYHLVYAYRQLPST